MKIIILPFLLITSIIFAQGDPEIYVMDLSSEMSNYEITNFRNISNNPGYDSQPSFVDNEKVIYAGTENGQTEIMMRYLDVDVKFRMNAPTAGGEYSPQQFPTINEIAAVRLDTTGLQRLYAYQYTNPGHGESRKLLKGLEVAYYAFHDNDHIIASVLAGNQLDLVIANLKTEEITPYTENVGRSIHKIPNSTSVSYTAVNEDGNYDIFIVDIDGDKESYFVCQLPIGIQDHCWLNENVLLLGSGEKLYKYELFGKQEWVEMADLSAFNISEISRITVSPNAKKIALVANDNQLTPAQIVDTHIAPFNSRNLEAFTASFSEDVKVVRFPEDIMYQGRDKLKSNYKKYYDRTKSSNVIVTNRIVLGSVVIDEEKVTVNGRESRQATIYTTANSLITSMTFVANSKILPDVSKIIDAQLAAYNNRNLDVFAATFSKDVLLKKYPNTTTDRGTNELKNGYRSFFENTKDLNCTITNRIVIGNKVIDEELVTINGEQIKAVAIYEVNEDGKISVVTFI